MPDEGVNLFDRILRAQIKSANIELRVCDFICTKLRYMGSIFESYTSQLVGSIGETNYV